MSDWDLLQWAIKNAGWSFHYSNDQVRSPDGAMTTLVNRSDLGEARRKRIIELMKTHDKAAANQ
jgi:hypothetical protein